MRKYGLLQLRFSSHAFCLRGPRCVTESERLTLLFPCLTVNTGSYIFSQSIFSLRSGIQSRVAGYTLAATQLLFLIMPFDLLAYVPSFVFGSLLIMICIDLVNEWLWEVRYKVTRVEYCICLTTFMSIQLIGVEGGILFGALLHMAVTRAMQETMRQSKAGNVEMQMLLKHHET